MTTMAGVLTSFDPLEVAVCVIALIGLVPVLTQYREETKYFALGYVLLVISAVATNLEAVVLPDVLNVVEHGAGIAGAGVVFLVAAYLRRGEITGVSG